MPKSYQYVLLDWDGNLAQTLDVWLRSYRTVLNTYEQFPDDRTIAASFGQMTKFFTSLGIDPRPAYDEADKLAKLEMPSVPLYPDVPFVLSELKSAGKKLALITSSNRPNVIPPLRSHGLENLFDAIISEEDVTKRKPDPEPLLLGLSCLDGRAEEAVMIGDSESDLRAAKAAGIDSVLFYPSEHEKYYVFEDLQQHQPTYVVSDFRAILGIVH